VIPFHPCGMVCDRIRTGYVARMRLWVDSDEEVEVRWFRAAPGALLLPGPHPWGSWWTWDRKDDPVPPALGEQRYVRYDLGGNDLGYEGTHHCGSAAAVSDGGLHGRDPLITTEAAGWASCCGAPPLVVCGRTLPRSYRLGNGTVSHCACVSNREWLLEYAGTDGGPNIPAGRHAWLTAGEWWTVSGPLGPPPGWVPYWGSCVYAPPVEVPARVQFGILIDPATCMVSLLVWQFWWKNFAVNSVLYGSDPLGVAAWVDGGFVFPPITSMHGESCGTGSGGGNPITYTAEPFFG